MAKKKKPEPKADIPRIRHLCSLGTLGGYGGKKGEWSAAKKLKQIRKAGFDGFLGRVHMLSAAEVQQSGLIFACTTDMGGPEDVEPKLTACKEHGARCVNVQMLDHEDRQREVRGQRPEGCRHCLEAASGTAHDDRAERSAGGGNARASRPLSA